MKVKFHRNPLKTVTNAAKAIRKSPKAQKKNSKGKGKVALMKVIKKLNQLVLLQGCFTEVTKYLICIMNIFLISKMFRSFLMSWRVRRISRASLSGSTPSNFSGAKSPKTTSTMTTELWGSLR